VELLKLPDDIEQARLQNTQEKNLLKEEKELDLYG
jgi:hypothetical protein